MTRFLQRLLLILLVLGFAMPARAHVGNKDIFQTVTAGPYKLYITIRTPTAIPGSVTIEVRSTGAPITSITMGPLMLTGEASKTQPPLDAMTRSTVDPAFFTGSLWLMLRGSWQVRFLIEGAAGAATGSVPVPAAASVLLPMQPGFSITLGLMFLLLIAGMTGIVVAAVREARLEPGARPVRDRRLLVAGVVACGVCLFLVFLGGRWWKEHNDNYAAHLYHPSELRTTLKGNLLELDMGNTDPSDHGAWKPVPNKHLLLDHGHVMHLYAIRQPEMDAAFHLHPAANPDTGLSDRLPSMPPGTYNLYGDVVYYNGFPETVTAKLVVPAGMPGVPLDSEDAYAMPPALSRGELGPAYKLPDGYTMAWDKPAAIKANSPYLFRFHLLDTEGKPAGNMQPYLGMAGHAAFVKTDGTAFAHTHPDGSAAMPAVMLADADNPATAGETQMSGDMSGMEGMSGMNESAEPISSTVEFPYGFPSPGRYRIFIQMKHGGVVETGVFDARVQ